MADILQTLPAPASFSSHYVGDGTANRAIPHGMNRIPKAVFIVGASGNALGVIIQAGKLCAVNTSTWAVTPADQTNFYVGNAGDIDASRNMNLADYYWCAI